MSIENDVIVSKLKDEGISEKLGNGLTFETDDELNVWVESYKSGQPTKIKGLSEYTKDELKELADKGENKHLQSLFDEIRTKAKPKTPEPKKTEQTEKPEWAAEIIEKLAKQETALAEQKTKDEAATNKANAIKLIKGHKITEDVHINKVLLELGGDFSEANIKAKAEGYIAFLTSLGIKHVPGKSDGQPDANFNKSIDDFVKNKTKQKQKLKKS